MFNGMMKSEIKKAETAANKFFGRNDCKVTGYYAKLYSTDFGYTWYEVTCEICFDYEERAECDVVVRALMNDRRRSFATVTAW